ncbi:polyribonucleotide nucleotidyltransferase [bacterium]|nr:polyribonucleotide nucleotidyltransferase [bacterium]
MEEGTKVKEFDWQGKKLRFETGRLAHFADASVRVDFGDTTVFCTVVVSEEPREDVDFFPLLVDYEEKFYASGKISGSRFIKREGKPSESAILNARLIDRPLRPLFPKDYRHDVQIIVTVLSYDPECPPEIPSLLGASLALCLSPAPFEGPVGAVRVGLKGGEFVLNPSDELEGLEADFVVVGNEERILMVEGKAKEVPEAEILRLFEWALRQLQFGLKAQQEFLKDFKIIKPEYAISESDIHIKISDLLGSELKKVLQLRDEEERKANLERFEERVLKEFEGDYKQIEIENAFNELIKKETRRLILEKGFRPDGRKEDEIRPLHIEVGVLARTHGSALFSRGETQVLSVTTLDSPAKEQMIETMEEEGFKRFMHHYNFPPYSTGEIRPLSAPSRREIGHGALVEKALEGLIPDKKEFPYTIRVVSEVLSSNGSTSMASTCASTLSLMDAGVPLLNPVAGIAMGLVAEEKEGKISRYRVLTDIQGIEDFSGDMDFKVAGTKKGITAIQLDVKIKGINFDIIKEVFERAKKARLYILQEMHKVLPKPKPVSPLAPVIELITIDPEKIRDVIGPGGKTIRDIIAQTGVEINIEPDGTVYISSDSANRKGVLQAKEWVKNLTREIKVGEIFRGKVTRVVDFGVFVEVFPGQEGLVHISELSRRRIRNIYRLVKVGDVIPVKVIKIDELGRLALSVKALPPHLRKEVPFPV